MADGTFDTVLLGGLLGRLKTAGYGVSIEHMLDIQAFFLSISLGEIKIAELKYLITPLIAKNKNEQEEIYAIIDDYIIEITSSEAYSKPYVPGYTFSSDLPAKQYEKYDGVRVFLISVLAFLLLLIGRIALMQMLSPKPYLPAVNTTDVYSNDTTTPNNVEPGVVKPAAQGSILPPKPNIISVTGVGPIQPREKNVNVQITILLGLIAGVVLSFIVFRTKENEYFPNDNDSNKARAKHPGADNDANTGDEAEGFDISLPVLVNFPGNMQVIRDDANTASIKRNMKKQKVGNSFEFNIAQTIKATAKMHGLYTLQFAPKKQQRKYLIIGAKGSAYEPVTNMFNSFVETLARSGVYIEKYTYERDFSTLADVFGKPATMRDLAVSKPDFELILFGSSDILFDALLNQPHAKGIALFNAWPVRNLVTNTALPDWSYMERVLARYNFNVVPLETGPVDLLIKRITGKQDLSERTLARSFRNVNAVNGFNFENTDEVEAYLNDDILFQVVCALALYPVLDWKLTITLYEALVDKNLREKQGDFNTLLKIARLPFLNGPRLNDNIRLALLQKLRKPTELTAREIIHAQLLKASAEIHAGDAGKTWILNEILLNEFFLYAGDRKKYKEFALSKKHIISLWRSMDDWALKNYIKSGNADIMPKNKSGNSITVEEFLVSEQVREKRKITFLRVATTLVPAGLMYLFMVTFKPAYAYPPKDEEYGLNPIIISVVKDSCSKSIVSIKLSGNNLTQPKIISLNNLSVANFTLEDMSYSNPVTIEYEFKGKTQTDVIGCRDSSYNIVFKGCSDK